MKLYFALNLLGCLSAIPALVHAAAHVEFDWETVTAAESLKYHPCYDGLLCARLILPLDWKNETNTETVSIAIIKVPAIVSQDDPTFGGTIITNPGGPGGSGVAYILEAGRRLRDFIDIPGKRHYEMLSFDPRGVAYSAPLMDCFTDNNLARNALLYGQLGSGSLTISHAAFAHGFAVAKGEGQRCQQAMEGFLPFVNTPSVARDMLAMVDKIDELRRNEAKKGRLSEDEEPRLELRSEGNAQEDAPRLQFIGFSYGTIIGNYFASLFPGRVGRMVLDGVCDADDYANDEPGFRTSTVNTDEMVNIFFQGCFAAGSDACKLYRVGDKRPSDISDRFWSWANGLDEVPITTLTKDGASLIWRAGDIRAAIFMALYNADDSFIKLAEILNKAMRGSTEQLVSAIMAVYGVTPLMDSCTVSNHTNVLYFSRDTNKAVICTDGDDVRGKNITSWRMYLKDQMATSHLSGELLTAASMQCTGWPARPNWFFKGPFKTPSASRNASMPEKGRPAAPLLFLSSRWDPVTPLRSARAMAKNHPGSGLMVQESMGHSALGTGIAGPCTRKVVSEYFDKGAVPSEETVCEGMRRPWDPVRGQDLEVAEHLGKMQKRRTVHNLFGV
ncbi:hypothetical protein QQS21_002872 [Conoideocrella luteorostrata]|uniref:Peptidase S33 tripeptidyl aminopeptidase-like C-terminal domain-containing protein n=1 Tax=Conoideocrella luteorostrata TaxID=1105319 RepID=A0AAJ0FWY0_9HYPO|nr:hypothetical protein QQS21_002872 [Conoideocrella luteorostrata]